LLEAGADPNHGSGKYTPLMNAASWVRYDAVQLLLERGADPLLKNERGQTALEVVGRAGGREKTVIDLLQQQMAER
jgi:ankyrin repeat protein